MINVVNTIKLLNTKTFSTRKKRNIKIKEIKTAI